MNDQATLNAILLAARDVEALIGEHDSTRDALERVGLDGDAVLAVCRDVARDTVGPVGPPQLVAAFAIGYLVGRDAT